MPMSWVPTEVTQESATYMMQRFGLDDPTASWEWTKRGLQEIAVGLMGMAIPKDRVEHVRTACATAEMSLRRAGRTWGLTIPQAKGLSYAYVLLKAVVDKTHGELGSLIDVIEGRVPAKYSKMAIA